MNGYRGSAFLGFLQDRESRGGLDVEDLLAAILPLFRQVHAAHQSGRVAPLGDLDFVTVDALGRLGLVEDRLREPRRNDALLRDWDERCAGPIRVAGESRVVVDLDGGGASAEDLQVAEDVGDESGPVFLVGYRIWEERKGHQDALTDVFALGQLAASLACGLDFHDPDSLRRFVRSRPNLTGLRPRLHPVVASVLFQMTELERGLRPKDLGVLIRRLETYRNAEADLQGGAAGPGGNAVPETGTGRRRRLLGSLRNRLFEISRRNRLIHFRPTLQTLNLTEASVPLVLDHRNIVAERLFYWHPEIARRIVEGSPLALGRHLRFEDAPYLPGVLEKIIADARRDQAEYGFAPLRLILCFLRWHNLKEAPEERIHSPLLLLPVELTRKRGVRDSYRLDPTTSEAEVNPALRHHLRELYGLSLPETVDLRETSLEDFHASLAAQIQASEPAVTLRLQDRPQIQLVHERARMRLDQFRRRAEARPVPTPSRRRIDYSYDREDYRPKGLALFHEWVLPRSLALRMAVGGAPEPRIQRIQPETGEADPTAVRETERKTYRLLEGDGVGPYHWDFDLCSLTLGNFNYRKMTLVRDYARLIADDPDCEAFDAVFPETPRASETAEVPSPGLAGQHRVVPSDAAQALAVERARSGGSFIIQGPPGTGKSQTITNLIADFVGRGKRVLFVCEKRAAIDVVFHRLKRQGLDALCCLIHDSQADKKAFVANLKESYEHHLDGRRADPAALARKRELESAMERHVGLLRRATEDMVEEDPEAGLPLRDLVRRLVTLGGGEVPEAVREAVPDYRHWMAHGAIVERLREALAESGLGTAFHRSPLARISPALFREARPVAALQEGLERAGAVWEEAEATLELLGPECHAEERLSWCRSLAAFATAALPMAVRGQLGWILDGTLPGEVRALSSELGLRAAERAGVQGKKAGWREPLPPADCEAALGRMRGHEASFLRFLKPGYWSLRRLLESRYDLSRHAVAPAWSRILSDLDEVHRAEAAWTAARERAKAAWKVEEPEEFPTRIGELSRHPVLGDARVLAWLRGAVESGEAVEVLRQWSALGGRLEELAGLLERILSDPDGGPVSALPGLMEELRSCVRLMPGLMPVLTDVMAIPEPMARALRSAPLDLADFEAAMGWGTLMRHFRRDARLARFDGGRLREALEALAQLHREWLGVNARCLRQAVHERFQERARLCAQSAAGLDPAARELRRSYTAGRRVLEHEFGKTMRFKSIRELAGGDPGKVVRDLKPVWLMSPLSVSDTLPLDPDAFDVVLFDEASQIPMEEAVPAVCRARQVIVVGDEMQLPPTKFFAASRDDGEDEEVPPDEVPDAELDADSFLAQAARNLPSTLLAWHYRSRSEALIGFSNAAFYGGRLNTIPDRLGPDGGRSELVVESADWAPQGARELLSRSISFHRMAHGVYGDRRNPAEAAYIARLIREILAQGDGPSLGVVAFSEAQQSQIEAELARLADEDPVFAARLETESVREEDDVFCGLFVKNLENVQGDERDVILISVCYARDANGRMLMNFGPINQQGGEKRLNVIFSRARKHMAIVSSIRHPDITNVHNDGARCLQQFLRYAEAVSRGDDATARAVLEGMSPGSRKVFAVGTETDPVVESVARALRDRGFQVDTQVGRSRFRCDLAVREADGTGYRLGILVDPVGQGTPVPTEERFLMQPAILEAFGWPVSWILAKDWLLDPETVLETLVRRLSGEPEAMIPESSVEIPSVEAEPVPSLPEPAGTSPGSLPAGSDETSPSTNSSQVPAFRRRLENVTGASRKFWEVEVSGTELTVRFGRIGSAGQAQSRRFQDPARARDEAVKLVQEKIRKGYSEVVG